MNKRKLNKILLAVVVFMLVANIAYPALVRVSIVRKHYPANPGGVPIDCRATLRDSLVLTTGYVSTDHTNILGYDNIGLYFNVTKGSLTSFQYKVQWSHNERDWFEEVTETIAAGSITDTTASYTKTLATTDLWYKPLPVIAYYMRVMVKGTGTVTGSLCEVVLYGRY